VLAASILLVLLAGKPAPVHPLAAFLPESAGEFHGSALEAEGSWVRRTYRRGPVAVAVTIASVGERVDYQQWVKMSADYPAFPLDVPGGRGSGFYDCAGNGAAERCDVHIHLANGHHVEVTSSGTATRGDVERLIRSLPLRALSER
jgi:hypothetical protein